ncbi:CDP-alcohol phosphatidyltransferase family protein [Anaerosporobacter faecicola]|uniref:CDP-alcohol phosphatidyltransferase family protein n=1 Tax=Anaerosporobacter faecicola TaxID=2718714 RepID=UPI00143C2C47|nr:CDP-alcohol phosphatidyltransferase family protein [Anaerosporobacter faecicola]
MKKSTWRSLVPNGITCFRIPLSISLCFFPFQTTGFVIIYILCGLTDVADGYLARKWNVAGKCGAMLDSIADFIFTAVLLGICLTRLKWSSWMLWWMLIIVIIRCFAICVCKIRYGVVAFLHTYGNKITGFLLFLFPLLYGILPFTMMVVLLCTVASFASVEELLIMITSKKLDRDQTGMKQ